MLPETGGGILTEKYYNYIYISSPIPFIIFGRFSMIAFELQLRLALVVGLFLCVTKTIQAIVCLSDSLLHVLNTSVLRSIK